MSSILSRYLPWFSKCYLGHHRHLAWPGHSHHQGYIYCGACRRKARADMLGY